MLHLLVRAEVWLNNAVRGNLNAAAKKPGWQISAEPSNLAECCLDMTVLSISSPRAAPSGGEQAQRASLMCFDSHLRRRK